MIKRLDRVAPLPVEEFPLPDPTVLSAEEQDRFRDLLEKGARAAEGNGTITKAELQDLERLWSACPPLPPGDGFSGPDIDVPRDLQNYCWQQKASKWHSYNFGRLRKVQHVRFTELCGKYGYQKSKSAIEVRAGMLPLEQWNPADRAELNGLLDIVSRKPNLDRDHLSHCAKAR
jgi:hypothetical protein